MTADVYIMMVNSESSGCAEKACLQMDAKLPIEVDPEIMSGTPVFRGTRVPVETLFNYLADGVSLDEFLDCFPTVNRADAQQILKHSKQEVLSEVTS